MYCRFGTRTLCMHWFDTQVLVCCRHYFSTRALLYALVWHTSSMHVLQVWYKNVVYALV